MQVRRSRAWIALRAPNNHLHNEFRRAVVRAAALLYTLYSEASATDEPAVAKGATCKESVGGT